MKIAICLSGHMRTYAHCSICYKPIKKIHNVDFYIHTWKNLGFGQVNYPIDTVKKIDLKNIKQVYKPKKIIIETYPYEPDISKFINPNIGQSDHDKIRVYNSIRKVKECFDLIDDPNQYDLIIRSRPDLYIEDFKLDFLDRNKINIKQQYWGDYWQSIHPYMINDFIAIGNPTNIRHYAGLYDKLEEYTQFLPLHPEVLLGYHVQGLISNIDINCHLVR
jgi:hypothetical protein